MPQAWWNGRKIADSDDTVVVEGNHYFLSESLDQSVLRPSATSSGCPWKGTAHYYTLAVDGAENKDAAWYYPAPKPEAAQIAGYVAFWKGVSVEQD